MALNFDPSAQTGIWGAIKGSLGLFNDTNKADGLHEDSNPTPIDPYESSLDETEVLGLIKEWKQRYSVYYSDIEKGQKISYDYWVGKHKQTEQLTTTTQKSNQVGVTDNLIFEAIETFLPIATRANPEPLVTAGSTAEEQKLAENIKIALANEADTQLLRRKLAKMTRGWLLNRLGALKVSWNPETKKIQTEPVSTKKMVFDPDGYIDERGIFHGDFLGEKKKASADLLAQMFPKKKQEIMQEAKDKKGTKLEYYEWWYRNTDVIYTLDKILLGKFKNPNWNYDGTEEVANPMTGEMEEIEVQGVNHLDEPINPYRFLAIFNTGEQPHDDTALILQNISQQDKINRREIQIERNVEGMNNGIIVSGSAFTEEQASQAASALRRGVAIRVPNGDVGKAVLFPQRPPLPGDVFKSLQDGRNELRNIFGTSGSSAEGLKSQETVRGKIMVNQADSSRIGGGVTDYIEQVADSIYNLWVQMMYVYYDEEHFVTSAGTLAGQELIAIKNDQFHILKTLVVTVKEGSLVPKDPLTQRNEAIDLWSANAIDPLSLYKKLDFPDPVMATNQLILWQMLQKGQIQPQQYLSSFTGEMANSPVAGANGQPPMEAPIEGQPPMQQAPPAPEAQSQALMQQVPIQ